MRNSVNLINPKYHDIIDFFVVNMITTTALMNIMSNSDDTASLAPTELIIELKPQNHVYMQPRFEDKILKGKVLAFEDKILKSPPNVLGWIKNLFSRPGKSYGKKKFAGIMFESGKTLAIERSSDANLVTL